MIVTCPHCDHTWDTRSRMRQITCPDCKRKFPQPAPVVRLLAADVRMNTTCDICGIDATLLNVCRVDGDAAIVCSTCLRKLKKEAAPKPPRIPTKEQIEREGVYYREHPEELTRDRREE